MNYFVTFGQKEEGEWQEIKTQEELLEGMKELIALKGASLPAFQTG